jgi:hypothetical protein
MTATRVETTPADRERIAQLVCGHMATRVISAAAALGLADVIADADRHATEVAAATGSAPDATLRLLRALAALGLLTEARPGAFRLTGAGALLRTDRPDSMHAFVGLTTHDVMLHGWEDLAGAVRGGGPAADTDFFGTLAADPALSEQFNAAMRQATRVAAQVLPKAFDFGRYDTVTDVGGGDGTLLAAVLAGNPGLRGVVYDTREGIAQAAGVLRAAGVADRCGRVSGDFFASVPFGADVYMLKSILHDWDDERAALILRNIRAVTPAHGRLLIVEPVLPDVVAQEPTSSALMYLSDLNMLVNLGGRERTRAEFAALCGAAGFELADVTSLAPARFSLIEAVAA